MRSAYQLAKLVYFSVAFFSGLFFGVAAGGLVKRSDEIFYEDRKVEFVEPV
ncbi:MAG: hypothetical protein ACD_47C00151G0002 [uncultured bacterium]|nr:MAG: hypothetical protein ACD_47C00151G0002 [uncultured bacterium]